MLLFKKKFLELIASGAKRQTVRIWPKRRLRAGQVEFVPGLGRVRVTAFEPVRPDTLTEEDARLDGFSSRAALLDELRALYGDRLEALPCFRIRFMFPADSGQTPGPARSGPGA
jgi:hypothetical protein